MAAISGLTVYPIKSCKGISCERAKIWSTGFAFDRRWVIVQDKNGKGRIQSEFLKSPAPYTTHKTVQKAFKGNRLIGLTSNLSSASKSLCLYQLGDTRGPEMTVTMHEFQIQTS
jgi:hypothetical protein